MQDRNFKYTDATYYVRPDKIDNRVCNDLDLYRDCKIGAKESARDY